LGATRLLFILIEFLEMTDTSGRNESLRLDEVIDCSWTSALRRMRHSRKSHVHLFCKLF